MGVRAALRGRRVPGVPAWPALVLLSCLAWPLAARADTTACIGVPTLPTDLFTPGRYCLHKNFDQAFNAGHAINIAVDGVVLDCNGHRLRNTDPAAFSNGITSFSVRRNVTIRNCVLDNFYVGIYLPAPADDTAVGNHIHDNTISTVRWAGIYVGGSNSRIERNRVVNMVADFNGSGRGIALVSFTETASGNVIRDNHITDARPDPPGESGPITGMDISNTHNTEVTGNVLTGLYSNTGNGTWSILGYGVSGAKISRNIVLAPPARPAPLDGGHYGGIYLSGTPEEDASNVCRDNVVGGFNTSVLGCVSTGNTTY